MTPSEETDALGGCRSRFFAITQRSVVLILILSKTHISASFTVFTQVTVSFCEGRTVYESSYKNEGI